MKSTVKHATRRLILTASLGCMMSLYSFAQDITVSGQVVDETGYPLSGAKVSVKGSETKTDRDGLFTIQAPVGTKVKVKYPGHGTSITTANQKMLITLNEFKRVTWNARAGLNIGALITNNDNHFDEHALGFQVGAGMEYAFTPNWVLQPSLMLYKKVYKDTTDNDNFIEDNKVGYDKWVADVYVAQLNVLAGYRWTMTDNFNLVFAVGPTLGYSFDGTLKRTLHHKGEKVLTKFDIFDGPKAEYDGELHVNKKIKEFDRFNIGVMGSITAEYDRYFLSLETAWEEHNTTAISVGIKF